MTALMVFLLIALNIQVFIFLAAIINSDAGNSYKDKKNEDFKKSIIKQIEKNNEMIEKIVDIIQKNSAYNQNELREIKNRLWHVRYIYNLLIDKEQEIFFKKQGEELGLKEVIESGNKEEWTRVLGVIGQRWMILKRSIERHEG